MEKNDDKQTEILIFLEKGSTSKPFFTSKYKDSMTHTPSVNWKYFFCLGRANMKAAMTEHTVGNMYSGNTNHGLLN